MTEPHVKWVKRANMWALITPEFDKKTNKMKNVITWHDSRPEVEPKNG